MRYIIKVTCKNGQFNPRVSSPDDAITRLESDPIFDYPNCTYEIVDDMQTIINEKIEQLWTAYNNYETSRISGSAFAGMALLALQGNTKALAVQQWNMGLWQRYYQQRGLISAGDTTIVPQPELAGDIPYGVKEVFFG